MGHMVSGVVDCVFRLWMGMCFMSLGCGVSGESACEGMEGTDAHFGVVCVCVGVDGVIARMWMGARRRRERGGGVAVVLLRIVLELIVKDGRLSPMHGNAALRWMEGGEAGVGSRGVERVGMRAVEASGHAVTHERRVGERIARGHPRKWRPRRR